jgi:uncharacterized protein YkwD
MLGGCSMANSTALTAGFANSGQPTTTAPPSRSSSRGDHDESLETPVRPQRNAKADDNIPKGTFERAPVGALADRDYSHTQLDADKARELINAYRKQKGLKPLRLNPALTEAAKAHSRDLAKWDRISHYGSDGSNPWDRVKRAGYNNPVLLPKPFDFESVKAVLAKLLQAPTPGH